MLDEMFYVICTTCLTFLGIAAIVCGGIIAAMVIYYKFFKKDK